ncbi:hypothetical protein LINPERPRIM_LOCUS11490 [Linum perenne]
MGDLRFPAGQRRLRSNWSCFLVCFQRCNDS